MARVAGRYRDEPTGAYMTVSSFGADFYVVVTLEVPAGRQGVGGGTRLMEEVCRRADAEGAALFLAAVGGNEAEIDRLVAWYRRFGFVEVAGRNRWGQPMERKARVQVGENK